ncbi:MAG TPA: hypothetical protein VH933_05375 [Aestuariivirgaceae bacterium]|jgi:hypothetical protein
MRSSKKGRSRRVIATAKDVKPLAEGARWHVTYSDGKTRTVKTSKKSLKTMEEATATYSVALARLADR